MAFTLNNIKTSGLAYSSPIAYALGMGEVRAKVLLTNATDAQMARQRLIPQDQVRHYLADAMVDTGAVTMVIPPHVLHHLGVESGRERMAVLADGSRRGVPVTSALGVEILGRDTIDEALVMGDEVLIGQTILEKTDLLVDCANRQLVPHPDHPDQPILKVK